MKFFQYICSAKQNDDVSSRGAAVIGSNILSGIFYAYYATIHGCHIFTILLYGGNHCFV